MTRWSSRITQSETYSSSPCRVRAPTPRSAVTTAVTRRAFSQRNRRRSSARSRLAFDKPANRLSIVSSTTRLAPTASMAWPRRTNSPSRSYSPVSSISARSTRTKSTSSFFWAERRSRSKPSDATFWASSSAVSSKAMNTPGSPISMPRTRNSTAKRVLPAPALPQTRVGRPRGRPPPVISSRPRMPLLALGNAETIAWPYLTFARVVVRRLPVSTAATSKSKWRAARPLVSTCAPCGTGPVKHGDWPETAGLRRSKRPSGSSSRDPALKALSTPYNSPGDRRRAGSRSCPSLPWLGEAHAREPLASRLLQMAAEVFT